MPSSAAARMRPVTYSIAPTSRPRVGCAATSTAGARDSSREHDPLLVATRERRHRRVDRRGGDVELVDERFGERAQPLGADERARAHPSDVAEDEVLRDRQLGDRGRAAPVFGDDTDPGRGRRAGAPALDAHAAARRPNRLRAARGSRGGRRARSARCRRRPQARRSRRGARRGSTRRGGCARRVLARSRRERRAPRRRAGRTAVQARDRSSISRWPTAGPTERNDTARPIISRASSSASVAASRRARRPRRCA